MSAVPASAKVLVIGGGPGGSYAATCLARENIDVVVLEADKFPRYHVGESQLASMRHFLRFIDLEKEYSDFGFQKKPGAGFKLNQHKREGYTDFVNPGNWSWNVVRSMSDELMLRYASRCGANVIEETKVTEIEFKGTGEAAQPIAALWKNKAGETGRITFDFVVDASGRNGLISNKYVKSRIFNDTLMNVASWGYWSGTGKYLPGTPRENSPFFEALIDESGWCWFIPLHDGSTSVGIVQNQDISNEKKARAKERGEDASTAAHYHRELKLAPNIQILMGNATMFKKPDAPLISAASDYSYHASAYAGPHYRLVGDAAVPPQIDPYFSSGVHLALSGGLSAAASICAVIRGQCTESEAAKYHHKKVDSSYTRFLLVVLSAYQQIRVQTVPVFSKDDNFDEAFDFFRPIIQGNSDTGKKLVGDDLNKTVEFLGTHAFEPSSPEERAAVMSTYGDVVDKLPASLSNDNVEDLRARNILKGIAIRKLMRTEDSLHINNETLDVLEGYRMVMQRGKLGLEKVEQ
ncbi:FAD/NAD(P)-binding domain-containing protein [Mycena rosella]|uniref:FAD/NAD(P)-binding domain-containing protein n=1 Tax=Mycena rosella TaxID=1033263 RepID=A0AAD7DA50_MYCRO|nr:FAD/NAD(P)-binding domain-containing protein [Mycena rosella]